MAYKQKLEEKLQQMVREGKIKQGSINHIDVAHDSWCKIYKGKECNCVPEIRYKGSE